MKTRAEINRQNYLKHRTARQDKARNRKRALTKGWEAAIAEWDTAQTPSDAACAASGLGEWSILASFAEPIDLLIEQEEASWA